MVQMMSSIIKKLILPKFPEIINFEVSEKFQTDGNAFLGWKTTKKYLVNYYFEKPFPSDRYNELYTETISLLKMIDDKKILIRTFD